MYCAGWRSKRCLIYPFTDCRCGGEAISVWSISIFVRLIWHVLASCSLRAYLPFPGYIHSPALFPGVLGCSTNMACIGQSLLPKSSHPRFRFRVARLFIVSVPVPAIHDLFRMGSHKHRRKLMLRCLARRGGGELRRAWFNKCIK